MALMSREITDFRNVYVKPYKANHKVNGQARTWNSDLAPILNTSYISENSVFSTKIHPYTYNHLEHILDDLGVRTEFNFGKKGQFKNVFVQNLPFQPYKTL